MTGNTNEEGPGEDKPLWDPSHPDGRAFIVGSELGGKLTKAVPNLKQIVHTADLWAHLVRYDVMQSADVERCKEVSKSTSSTLKNVSYLEGMKPDMSALSK